MPIFALSRGRFFFIFFFIFSPVRRHPASVESLSFANSACIISGRCCSNGPGALWWYIARDISERNIWTPVFRCMVHIKEKKALYLRCLRVYWHIICAHTRALAINIKWNFNFLSLWPVIGPLPGEISRIPTTMGNIRESKKFIVTSDGWRGHVRYYNICNVKLFNYWGTRSIM